MTPDDMMDAHYRPEGGLPFICQFPEKIVKYSSDRNNNFYQTDCNSNITTSGVLSVCTLVINSVARIPMTT